MKKIILVFTILSFLSCKNDKKEDKSKSALTKEVLKESYKFAGDEVLKNVKFNRWDTNAKPSYWSINQQIDNPEKYVVDRDTLSLLIKGSNFGLNYIKQNVIVSRNTFYLASCKVKTSLLRNNDATLVILSGEELIGKKTLNISDNKEYRVLFNSLENTDISFYLGFNNLGGGRIEIDSLSLKEISINENFYESKVCNVLNKNISIEFNDSNSFDQSVQKIIKQIGSLLLDSNDENNLDLSNQKNEIVDKLNNISVFKGYLTNDMEVPTKFYTTKLVNSSIEILNEFNIGTQKIELYRDNYKIHLLLNYYNPFSNKWITIDPYYNSKLNVIGGDISGVKKSNIELSDFGGLSNNIDELLKKYNGVKTVKKQEKIMGYPY